MFEAFLISFWTIDNNIQNVKGDLTKINVKTLATQLGVLSEDVKLYMILLVMCAGNLSYMPSLYNWLLLVRNTCSEKGPAIFRIYRNWCQNIFVHFPNIQKLMSTYICSFSEYSEIMLSDFECSENVLCMPHIFEKGLQQIGVQIHDIQKWCSQVSNIHNMSSSWFH